METLYTDLSDYYVFDKQKYLLEEFFTDLKTFKDSFRVSSYFLYFVLFKQPTIIVLGAPGLTL